MFAEVSAVRVPGRVVWCNFELAREIGFDVPAWPRMTRALHEQLLAALSWRVLQPGEDVAGRETITLYADQYGGDGIAPYLGSARAAFTPYGDILVKGIGLTPLFQQHDKDDFQHSHGGCNMDEAFAEAVQAEVSEQLFEREPARILAIVDQDDYTIFPDSTPKRARALIARVGLQLRPAHILAGVARRNRRCCELFVNITRETGQLVERDGVPDIKATMLRVMHDHAGAAAEQVRWRVTHGCISTSNMLMSGGMLDVVIQTTHARIAGVAVPRGRKNPDRLCFRDYLDRVRQMGKVYRALRKSLDAGERHRLHAAHINAHRFMAKAYHHHLDEAMLRAAGIKRRVAETLRAAHPELVRRFREVMVHLAELRNPGRVCDWHARLDRLAVVDILHLLREYPAVFFHEPRASHRKAILRGLDPVHRGNRYHIRRSRRIVKKLAREFEAVYRELMAACGDTIEMQQSVIARAAFENAPLTAAYRIDLYDELNAEIGRYKTDGDASRLERVAWRRIAAASRNIDALLFGSPPRRRADSSVELNVRFVDGVRCAVRAWEDGTRRVQLAIQVRRMRDRLVTSLPHDLALLPEWIESLRFNDVPAVLRRDEIVFDVPVHEPYGELHGTFTAGEMTLGELRGYVYAMPDAEELRELKARATAARRARVPA